MTIDPAIVVGFIGSILALLGLVFRAFMSGELHPRSTVPRTSFDALVAINASHTEAIGKVAETVKKLATALGHVADNGTANGTEKSPR